MNFKFIVLSIGIFLALISNGIDNTENENIINQKELNVVVENAIQLDEIQEENASILENIIVIDDTEKEIEIVAKIEETEKTEEKQEEIENIEKNTKINEQKVIVQNTEITQNDNSKQNNNNQEIREEQKSNVIQLESKPKELTPDDLEYWCVAGGSHHVAGDGENEHGYYNTWDEAYNAFLNHTADWSSSQYKVSCCSCGLYYFWAIQ